MHATDRESYAAGAERLAGYAAGVEPPVIVKVADELLAFAGILLKQPRLRRALIAPTRSAQDRVGLLRSLLSGRVADATVDLAAALVAGRWSRPSELLDAAERLAVDALLTAAEQTGELATVEDELFRFSRIVAGDPQLSAALGDLTGQLPRRESLLRSLLSGRARPTTLRLAEIALIGYGGRSFAGSLTRLVEMVAERRERTVAYVTTAVALTSDQEERLAAVLAARYGTQISLKVEVDPQVIGGASVRVGADLYDGTVRRRLGTARQLLAR